MKKIKPKMNENQKIEFILSYCDQLVGDHISQQDYLVFKKELRDSLEASHSIPNHKSESFNFYTHKYDSASEGTFTASDKIQRLNRGLQKTTGLKKTKLSRATLSQLKKFADFKVLEFLGKENRV